MITLGDILDYLRKDHPDVVGISPPEGNSRELSELSPSDLTLHFTDTATKAAKKAAKDALALIDFTKPIPSLYARYRESDFQKIKQGDMNDAVRKGVQALVADLMAAKILSPETIELFTPSKEKREDTPGGYFALIDEIKAKYPKDQ